MSIKVATDPPGQEFAARASRAMLAMCDCVDMSPDRLGGKPVLRGTRFSIAQLFAELADSDALAELAQDFELDAALLQRFLHALAMHLDKPVSP